MRRVYCFNTFIRCPYRLRDTKWRIIRILISPSLLTPFFEGVHTCQFHAHWVHVPMLTPVGQRNRRENDLKLKDVYFIGDERKSAVDNSETFEIDTEGEICEWQTTSEIFRDMRMRMRASFLRSLLRNSRHEFQWPMEDSGLSTTPTWVNPRVVWTVAGGKEGDLKPSAIGIPEHLS